MGDRRAGAPGLALEMLPCFLLLLKVSIFKTKQQQTLSVQKLGQVGFNLVFHL